MKKQCKRCLRDDLKLLSNGYCTRCDEALYGEKDNYPQPWVPQPWVEPTKPYPSEPWWTKPIVRFTGFEQPCLIEGFFREEQKKPAPMRQHSILIHCPCPRCSPWC